MRYMRHEVRGTLFAAIAFGKCESGVAERLANEEFLSHEPPTHLTRDDVKAMFSALSSAALSSVVMEGKHTAFNQAKKELESWDWEYQTINLTGHDVIVPDHHGKLITYPKADSVARIEVEETDTTILFEDPTPLPMAFPGVRLIVSSLYAAVYNGASETRYPRTDMFVPVGIHRKDGVITHCDALKQVIW